MSSFARTGSLVRLGLRLDRVRLLLWIVAIPAITYATASAFRELYPTVESRLAFSLTLANAPALVALTGPPFDLSSIGGPTAWRVDLSPFTHVPQFPGQPISWAPLLILTAVATAMSAAGVLGFRNRDIG